MKFKVGDYVVAACIDTESFVNYYDKNYVEEFKNRVLKIKHITLGSLYPYDVEGYNVSFNDEELVSLEIYNSSLYKLMREQNE